MNIGNNFTKAIKTGIIVSNKGDNMSKKNISLIVSIVLTLFIFTMSILPGSESGELSSNVSLTIKNIWDGIFTNRPISIDFLNSFIRKGAHVFEFMVLGISYFYTAKYWQLSILKVSMIGLLTAGIDEFIQIFVPGRAASWADVLLYDFGGFMLGLGLMLLILNRPIKVSETEILDKLRKQEISSTKAYKYLYHNEDLLPVTSKAHFVKLSIKVPDDPTANKFLKVLLFFPIPLGIVRFGLRFVKDKITDELPKEELLQIIQSKGIRIKVNAHSGEKIIIKTF
jgi:VanZ family protein